MKRYPPQLNGEAAEREAVDREASVRNGKEKGSSTTNSMNDYVMTFFKVREKEKLKKYVKYFY